MSEVPLYQNFVTMLSLKCSGVLYEKGIELRYF